QRGEDDVVARLGGEMRVEIGEIVGEAAMENLFAVAAVDGGFAGRAGGDQKAEGRNQKAEDRRKPKHGRSGAFEEGDGVGGDGEGAAEVADALVGRGFEAD